MSIDFSRITGIQTSRGLVTRIEIDGKVAWNGLACRYVSLGDSIAAGQRIREEENLIDPKCYSWQFGTEGVASTAIIEQTYTDRIRDDAVSKYTANRVKATSFARSGDTVAALMNKLSQTSVINEIKRANVVTICIGANDILGCVTDQRIYDYAMTGDLTVMENEIKTNLDRLENNNVYTNLFETLQNINPNAKYVFTTVYNPYKYLHLDEGQNGFFKELLGLIPNFSIDIVEVLGLGWTGLSLVWNPVSDLKNGLLSTDIFQYLFARINQLSAWVEERINRLNSILRTQLTNYKSSHPNFYLAETKTEFERYPDRTGTPLNGLTYDDLVNVEFTRGYTLPQANWGTLWGNNSVESYWRNLVINHTTFTNALWSTNVFDYVSFDMQGFANDLMNQILLKVIIPDIDPHPEEGGHKVLHDSFISALGDAYLNP